MKLPKSIDRLIKTYISPIRCSRCGKLLYNNKDRDRGISRKCLNKNLLHEHIQKELTFANKFFYTVPHSKNPSQYYDTLSKCEYDARKRINSKVWMGSYDSPSLISLDGMRITIPTMGDR
jgi:hypothetical protein